MLNFINPQKIEIGDNVYNLNSSDIINVVDIGVIEGDITKANSNKNVLQNLFDMIYNRETSARVVFFPRGIYYISGTLIIPSDITLIGSGKSTTLYGTDYTNYWGTFLGTAGSNITIDGFTLAYTGDDRPFYIGANQGALGIGNGEYLSSKNATMINPAVRINVKNIVVKNIWSDSNYVIQTENGGDFIIDGVTYENIYAPKGVVSVAQNVGAYHVTNININNVVCNYMRCGWGYPTLINVSNVNCNAIKCGFDGGNFSNINIKCTDEFGFNTWSDFNDYGVVAITSPDISLSNITVDRNGTSRNIFTVAGSLRLSNCEIKGDGNGYGLINVADVLSHLNNVKSNGKNSIKAISSNCDIANNEKSLDDDTGFKTVGIVWSGEWILGSASFDNFVRYKDGNVYVSLWYASRVTEGIPSSSVGTLPTIYRPSKKRTIFGSLWNSTFTETRKMWLDINTDGTINVNADLFEGRNWIAVQGAFNL